MGQALLSHWGETGRETSDEGAMPLLLLPLQLPGAGGLQNFPQFVVIHTVKGFGVVHKAEVYLQDIVATGQLLIKVFIA